MPVQNHLPQRSNSGKELGWDAVHQAAFADDVTVLESIEGEALERRTRNDMHETPLHVACRGAGRSHTRVSAACYLIIAGSDVNAQRGTDQRTPLHIASRNGNLKLVQLILDSKGVLIDARDILKLCAYC